MIGTLFSPEIKLDISVGSVIDDGDNNTGR